MPLNLRGRIVKLEGRCGFSSEPTTLFWAVIDGRANVEEVAEPELRATLLRLFRRPDPNESDPIEEAIRLATYFEGQARPPLGRDPV